MGFNCLKTIKPLRGDNLLFTTKSPGDCGTHLVDLRRMKGCPWNDPVVLNPGSLDSESRALPIRYERLEIFRYKHIVNFCKF